jgi:hypothetical protein
MSTDYTALIAVVIGLVVVMTGMVTFLLSRPSDLTPRP